MLDKEELRSIVAQVLDVDTAEITDDVRFVDDLEVDSLLALEIVVVLEKKYGVKLPESELRQIVTLQSAYDLLAGKLQAV
ncbi:MULTISPECIES: acyl carrier protein [Streptomyces]|uniref:Acyl carrier protein n=2 Tax=Streptomyces viridosporus TaxID=67581 RepID=D6A926_STRV1|nr:MULTISPECIES: acyl carrier protein [Streptomyces]EFE66244.1 polyketide-8 synthase acyl carrier protein 2 [Streptomyces viridosporus ATCC 14672]PWJ03026.1 acyl carrier protein [Streptomyces sp. NWU49]QEU88466.1 acyl carrier protein [Streptomyces viridosporus T7A]QNH67544.1 Cip16 [Streptomyces viridosporus ATCC 14672]